MRRSERCWVTLLAVTAVSAGLMAVPESGWFMAPHFQISRIRDKPFSAAYYEERKSATGSGAAASTKQSGMIYRASDGSSRREFVASPSPGVTASIADIYRRRDERMIVLDLDTRAVLVNVDLINLIGESAAPAPVDAKAWRFYHGYPEYTREFRTIEHLRCERILLWSDVRKVTKVGETWWSDELQVPIEHRHRTAEDEVIWRLSKVQLREPDSSLFSIPPDYTSLPPG